MNHPDMIRRDAINSITLLLRPAPFDGETECARVNEIAVCGKVCLPTVARPLRYRPSGHGIGIRHVIGDDPPDRYRTRNAVCDQKSIQIAVARMIDNATLYRKQPQ